MRKLLAAAGITVAVGLAAGLALVASRDDADRPPPALTAAEWRAQANAICRDIGSKVRAVPLPKEKSEITPFVVAVLPLWRQEADAMRALVPPNELASAAGQYVTQLDYLATWLLEIYVARERNDGAREGESIKKTAASADDVKAWAKELQLTTCAAQRIP